MTRVSIAALAALFLVAACAGPRAPIDVGSKEVPIDLLLGAKVAKVAQAPLPPLEIPVTPQGLVTFRPVPVLEPPAPATTEPPGPCPEMDPLAVPKKVATNNISAPPKPGTYTARTVGRFRVGGANAQDVLLNPSSTIVVGSPMQEAAGTTTFDFTVKNGNAETTSTYRIVPLGVSPSPPAPPSAGGVTATVPNDAPKLSPAAPGLYLARVSSPGSVGFTPTAPGILVTRFPIDLGTTIDTSGTDGVTTTSWRTTVKAKETVDACGTPIDTYRIELSNGRTVTGKNAESITFTGVINLGTQYGGLPLFQRTDATGTQGTAAITRSVQLTFDSEPAT